MGGENNATSWRHLSGLRGKRLLPKVLHGLLVTFPSLTHYNTRVRLQTIPICIVMVGLCSFAVGTGL